MEAIVRYLVFCYYWGMLHQSALVSSQSALVGDDPIVLEVFYRHV